MGGGNGGNGSGDADEEGTATCSASDFLILQAEVRQQLQTQHAMLEQIREQISSSNTRILDLLSTITAGTTHAEHNKEAVSNSDTTAAPPHHKEERTVRITQPAEIFSFASLCFKKD